MVNSWVPWVHIDNANLKRFLLGTCRGILPNYIQDYPDKLGYCYKRRFRGEEIPRRLLFMYKQRTSR